MKTIQFRIIIIVAFMLTVLANAQKKDKNFKERFIVKSDVIIDINTKYTDIEIETWDKNEVVVEAFMKIDGEDITEKIRDDFYKKWKFEAYGNSSKINIKSRTDSFIDIHSFNFDSPNYELFTHGNGTNNMKIFIPDVSIGSLDILDSLDFLMPEMPELPEMPERPELPELPELPPMPTHFDFKAYKNDKNYLERWKKENKNIISKNAKIKVGKNSISINSSNNKSSYKWNITTEGQNQLAEELEESLSKAKEQRHKAFEKRQEAYIKRSKESKKLREKFLKRSEKRNEAHKLALIKRQELFENRRKDMKALLEKREKIKVKRHIVIKAPKGAKFNMNVRYGTLSFPKN
ncbi:MAG: hypothetical protein L3J20_12245 [Flavobacteriaceae bacterium]|nr:hypothetical protein [Flavobacteriaceae bacterium]